MLTIKVTRCEMCKQKPMGQVDEISFLQIYVLTYILHLFVYFSISICLDTYLFGPDHLLLVLLINDQHYYLKKKIKVFFGVANDFRHGFRQFQFRSVYQRERQSRLSGPLDRHVFFPVVSCVHWDSYKCDRVKFFDQKPII